MDINGKVESARAGGGAILLSLWGITLDDWLLIISILYFLLQVIILLPRAIAILRGAWNKIAGIA